MIISHLDPKPHRLPRYEFIFIIFFHIAGQELFGQFSYPIFIFFRQQNIDFIAYDNLQDSDFMGNLRDEKQIVLVFLRVSIALQAPLRE